MPAYTFNKYMDRRISECKKLIDTIINDNLDDLTSQLEIKYNDNSNEIKYIVDNIKHNLKPIFHHIDDIIYDVAWFGYDEGTFDSEYSE